MERMLKFTQTSCRNNANYSTSLKWLKGDMTFFHLNVSLLTYSSFSWAGPWGKIFALFATITGRWPTDVWLRHLNEPIISLKHESYVWLWPSATDSVSPIACRCNDLASAVQCVWREGLKPQEWLKYVCLHVGNCTSACFKNACRMSWCADDTTQSDLYVKSSSDFQHLVVTVLCVTSLDLKSQIYTRA